MCNEWERRARASRGGMSPESFRCEAIYKTQVDNPLMTETSSPKKYPADWILDQKSVPTLLIYIATHGGCAEEGFQEIAGGHGRLKQLAILLVEKKLVERHIQTSPFRKYTYTITDRGREVISRLENLEDYIQQY